MARVLYFDCFSGAAGDMLLGALLDAGVPEEALRTALGSLGVDHELRVSRVIRAGVTATRVEVFDPHEHHQHNHQDGHHQHQHHHHHRSLADILSLVARSGLSPTAKDRITGLFRRLGEAEAAIHGVPVETVHFHEVGAVDSIVDIAGVVLALEWFGCDDVVASPMNVGGGTVQIAHGTFPVPAPATARLLTGVPVFTRGPEVELVTPTGALLVSAYARAFGGLPPMTVERVGYGAGARDFATMPNVVRVIVGERTSETAAPAGSGTIVKVECEIDDMNPQWFEPAAEKLFAAGAVDVFTMPVQMKKGRPGILLTVLAPEDRREAVCDILFRDTTTIGVRFERMWRETLDRRWEPVPTAGGPVRIKVSGRRGETLNAQPEFEDCLRIARATGRPLKDVQAEALRAWFARGGQ